MIPVALQPEPDNFDELVRQPGLDYLCHNPHAKASQLPPLWREFNAVLWKKYNGVCAYLAIYFHYSSGAGTTDHFAAKSKSKEHAYEWSNYRLACLGANRKKHTHEVLDPIMMENESFFINFANGDMYPNPQKNASYRKRCQKTIDLLELNSEACRKMRYEDFEEYRHQHIDLDFLRRHSPFVYYEVIRQGI